MYPKEKKGKRYLEGKLCSYHLIKAVYNYRRLILFLKWKFHFKISILSVVGGPNILLMFIFFFIFMFSSSIMVNFLAGEMIIIQPRNDIYEWPFMRCKVNTWAFNSFVRWNFPSINNKKKFNVASMGAESCGNNSRWNASVKWILNLQIAQ